MVPFATYTCTWRTLALAGGARECRGVQVSKLPVCKVLPLTDGFDTPFATNHFDRLSAAAQGYSTIGSYLLPSVSNNFAIIGSADSVRAGIRMWKMEPGHFFSS